MQVASSLKNQRGNTIIELLIAIILIGILTPMFYLGIQSPQISRSQEESRSRALAKNEKSTEIIKTISQASWQSVKTNGVFHPVLVGTDWDLATGSEMADSLTHSITIDSVLRNAEGDIVTTGGQIDPSTKLVTYTSSWTYPISASEISTHYITRFAHSDSIVHTTKAQFDLGSKTMTQATTSGDGTIALLPTLVDKTYVLDYANSTDYIFDPAKIEFVDGQARLKNTGSAGVAGSTVNSSADQAQGQWTVAEFGSINSQSGAYSSSGGNPGSYLRMTFPKEKNKTAGVYWSQPFTITSPVTSATLNLQWRSVSFTSGSIPDIYKLYAFIDTTSSNPTIGQEVWSSSQITGTTSWSGTVTVDVKNKLLTAGTYYLKIVGYVDYNNSHSDGAFTSGFDNIIVNWQTAGAPSYASDSPTVISKTNFTDTNIYSWNGFQSIENPAGGSVKYQLSNDNGVTWKYHNGSIWATATSPTQSNSATEINTNITSLPTSSQTLLIKTLLISNGSQQVAIDNLVTQYKTISPAGSTGEYVSPSINQSSEVAYHRIAWLQDVPTGASIKLQYAVNNDGTTWNFVGPDGTASTFYTGDNFAGGYGTIPFNASLGQYFKYRLVLFSNSLSMPSVDEVWFNYSP